MMIQPHSWKASTDDGCWAQESDQGRSLREGQLDLSHGNLVARSNTSDCATVRRVLVHFRRHTLQKIRLAVAKDRASIRTRGDT
jgi:hypothetical protein